MNRRHNDVSLFFVVVHHARGIMPAILQFVYVALTMHTDGSGKRGRRDVAALSSVTHASRGIITPISFVLIAQCDHT